MRDMRRDERGSALITALLAAMVMLAMGIALLAIVDTQAKQSGLERMRDRGFNLAETVLNEEAFVIGRSWPTSGVSSCGAAGAGFSDTIGSSATPSTQTALLRSNIDASYTDSAYSGATWQVNVCDDSASSTVWNDATNLTNKGYDANANNKVWVRVQASVGGKTRTVVGLVTVRTTAAFDPKFGLVSGGLTDDLGATVNNLSSNALGGVLGGLLGSTPSVAKDPSVASTTSSGVTGLRCGATDISLIPASTCVAGTIGAAGALPVVNSLLTGGQLAEFPTTTTTSGSNINQLRTQAIASNTYYKTTSGSSTAASAPACNLTTNTGTKSASTVVFIETVGTGDQFCYIDVGSGVQYKALVVGSGRIIIRGNGTTTAAPLSTVSGPQVNTFSGVVYALNLQRLTTAEGGLNLGDSASPGREVVRIENGAHVKGAVNADGKSAKIGIYPPQLTLSTNALVDSLIPCKDLVSCLLNSTVKALSGVTSIVDSLVSHLGLSSVVTGILGQLQPQRANYGSAITSDMAAINAVTVYGASGVVGGTFRDLQQQ